MDTPVDIPQSPVTNTKTPMPPSADLPKQPIPMNAPKKLSLKKIIIGLVLLTGVLLGVLLAQYDFGKKETTPVPTPTPVIIATPTPLRTLSPIASDSAFLQVESDIASLSSALGAVQVTDTRLSPPSIELDLGFPRR